VAWSVLEVRDPASAALAIVKGLTVTVDVLRMQFGGAPPPCRPLHLLLWLHE